MSGTGTIYDDPLFRNYAEGNYQLSTGSPCIDTGDDTPVTYGTDLAGNARKQDIPGVGTASVDMGAYEYNAALTCGFLASPWVLIASPTTYQSFGTAPFTVQFTGWADGADLTGLQYRWDFGDGGGYGSWGGGNTASYTYTNAGVYNPRLQVTNTAAEVAEKIKSAYVSAGSTHYVVTNNPSAAAPYTNWATAASNNIQAAINAATLNGSAVIVSNGTYGITAQITITNILTVRSFERGLSGASNTVVQRSSGSIRIFSISNTYAVVEGLSITNGFIFNAYNGGGVNLSAGLVRDCIIRNNGNGDNGNGGGVYMTDGTVSNCIIKSNAKNGGDREGGGGVWASGGLITHCQITDNTVGGGDDGGGVRMSGGTIRNSLCARNTTEGTGGGVYMTGGTVESCTIVSNSAVGANGGGGVYRKDGTAGTVSDSIVYFNTAPNNVTYENFYKTSDAGLDYTCTTNPVVEGTGCISAAPLFGNLAGGDYSLQKTSRCIDEGMNQAWMVGAKDLAGNDRILKGTRGNIVDMGCYETFIAPAGTVLVLR